MKKYFWGTTAAICGSLLLASTTVSAGTYTFYDLGTLDGGSSQAYGLNDHRQVVGTSVLTNGELRAFTWNSATGMQDIGSFGGTETWAYDINNAGLIVGGSNTPDAGPWLPFATTGAVSTSLFPLPEGATGAFVRVTNESGLVAGEIQYADGSAQAFSFDTVTNTLTMLGTFGGDLSYVLGINDNGDIVGYATAEMGPPRGFVYRDGVMIDTGTLQHTTFAFDVNNAGQVSGRSRVTESDGTPSYHAFLWDAINGISDLGTFGFQSANLRELNHSGWGLGWGSNDFFSGDASFEPFLYELLTGNMIFLNDLLPATAGWDRIQFGFDINEHGDVVGYGRTLAGETHAFLLAHMESVPAPAVLPLLMVGLFLLRKKQK